MINFPKTDLQICIVVLSCSFLLAKHPNLFNLIKKGGIIPYHLNVLVTLLYCSRSTLSFQ